MDNEVVKHSEEQPPPQKGYSKGVLKFVKATILVIAIFVVFILTLQLSFVQKQIFDSFTKLVYRHTDYKIGLGKLDFDIFDNLYLENLTITDKNQVPLIKAQSVKISFSWLELFSNEGITLERAEISNSHYYQQYNGGKANIQKFIDQLKVLFKKQVDQELKTSVPESPAYENPEPQAPAPQSKATSSAPPTQYLFIKAIDIKDSYFHYCNNPHIKETPNFSFEDLNTLIEEAQIKDFLMNSDALTCAILRAKGEEVHGNFKVEDLKTKFLFSDYELKFWDVETTLKNHYLKSDSIYFSYTNLDQLTNFDSLKLLLNISESQLSIPHLAWIFEPFANYKDTANLKLNFEKRGQSLRIKDLDAKFGQTSHLKLKDYWSEDYKNWLVADYKVEGLDVNTNKRDLELYLPPTVSHYLPSDYKITNFKCDLDRNDNEFQAQGFLSSDLLISSFETYSLEKKYAIDLGLEFIDIDQIFKLNLPLKLYDSRLKLAGQDLERDFTIDSLEFQSSNLAIFKSQFSNFKLKANYRDSLLKLDYNLADTNLNLTASNYIDFETENFSGNVILNKLDLAAFKFLDQPVQLGAKNIAFTLNSFDFKRANGRFIIDSITLSKPNLSQDIPYLYLDLESDKELLNKALYMRSSIVDAEFNIDMPDTSHLSYLVRFVQNFKRNLLLEANLDQYKYFGDYPYELDGMAKLHNLNPILTFFDLPVRISPASELKIDLNLNDLNYFKFGFESDSVAWADFKAEAVLLDIDMLEAGNDNFDIDIRLQSQTQTYRNFKNDDLKLLVNSTSGQYNFQIQNKNRRANEVNLLGRISLVDSNTILVDLDTNSTVHLLDTFWTIKPNHKISFTKDTILVKDFELALGEQRIRFETQLKHLPTDYLRFSTHEVAIKPLSSYLGKDVAGTLNFNFNLYTPYDTAQVAARGTISNLLFQNFAFDTLFVALQQDPRKIALNGYLKQNTKDVIAIDGFYEPDLNNPFIDLQLVLRGMPVKIIEPFVNEYISELDGGIVGVILIQGNLYDPQINGDAYVVGGQFKINYLNTLYKLTDRFYFQNNDIFLKNIRLTDDSKRQATINGTIKHSELRKFTYDLKVDLEEFIVMDIPETNNALYYGLATITGNLTIKTNPSNLIDLKLKGYTGQNTRVFFPFSSSSLSQTNALEQSYITFLKDTNRLIQPTLTFEPQKHNFTIAIDLEVTPDAHVQMIFDQKKGDLIRGQGRGNLLLNYDENGEFTIFGDVNVVKGDYHFTLLNLIDKKFIIEPDSRLTWSGDPYNAQLNLHASYNQKANLLPILEEYERTDLIELPESKIQYPVKVLLFLEGSVNQPTIKFGIDFENYPLLFQDVLESFKYKIDFDLQERNKQVFSLIALKRFAQQSKFSVSESAGKLVTEFFSNQFSYWVSQIDPNLEISLDIENNEQDALSNLQLSISYSFWNGRAKITHENVQNFNRSSVQNSSQAAQASIGDWTLEYSLLDKSNLKLKVYHRQNANSSDSNLADLNTSKNGVSISHTGGSDTLKDIFRRKRKGRK